MLQITEKPIGKPFSKNIPWNKNTKGICKPNSGSFKKGQCEGKKNPMYGTVCYWAGTRLTNEHKQKISNGLKGKKKSLEHRKNLSIAQQNKAPDSWSTRLKKSLSHSKSDIKYPFKNTVIEKIFSKALQLNNIQYKEDKIFKIGNKHHRVDFFIEPNIVIECDGCYWHGCKQCNTKKQLKSEVPQTQIKRDPIVNSELKKQGLNVFRFWEHEIKTDVQKCIEEVMS